MKKRKDIYFKKTDSCSATSMTFDQDMLKLLMAIDENKSITEVAKETQFPPAVFKDILVKLYNLKLIEKVEKKVEYINGQFLNNVRKELIHLLGPIGGILMEDAEDQLNLKEAKVPKNLVAEYLLAIANEIPNETQRRTFQKNMLGELKSLNNK